MTDSGWTLSWAEPARLSFALDRSSPTVVAFRVGETGIVQFTLGDDARLRVETASGVREISGSDAPSDVVDGVLGVHALHLHAPIASEPGQSVSLADTDLSEAPSAPPIDFDETILTPRAHPAAAVDVDATILTSANPAPADRTSSLAEPSPDFDATILTPAAAASTGAPAAANHSATPHGHLVPSVQISDATGTRVVRLDRPLYVGRSPRVPHERGSDGSLSFVQSATDHVSATHLHLRDDDGTVLVRDLRSTNGTMITPPLGQAFLLAPGEVVPVAPGARVQLSDDVVIEVLSAEAREHRAE